jgi:hypothetical protein
MSRHLSPSSLVWLAPASLTALLLVAEAAGAEPPAGPLRQLDDTGVTHCRVRDVWSTSCPYTSQDANTGRDAADTKSSDGRAGFRFQRVCGSGEAAGTGTCPAMPARGTGPDDWGCTRDRVTGLLWELKTDDGSLRDRDQLIAMQEWGWGFPTVTTYRALLDGLAVCGSTTWEAPTPTEIQSIVDYGVLGTRVDGDFFPEAGTSHPYGTPFPTGFPNETLATGVSFADGSQQWTYPGDGTFVRLVTREGRRGVHGERFRVVVDGTQVIDTWTGLAWMRCRVGMYLDDARTKCLGTARGLTWEEAVRLPLAGTTWRVPNLKEMLSLANLDDGLTDPVAFPRAARDTAQDFWTSTPAWQPTDTSWYVAYRIGEGFEFETRRTHKRLDVLLVRDVQAREAEDVIGPEPASASEGAVR